MRIIARITTALLAVTALSCGPMKEANNTAGTSGASAADVAHPGSSQFEPFVELGSEQNAKDYYARSDEELGAALTNIGELLTFCGYADKTAFDLLRKDVPADDKEILAVPYFAPKIINVAEPNPKLGWRKVIRLKVRPDSAGAKKGVTTMYLLFNVFLSVEELKHKSPFIDGSAENNQALLVRDKTLYWYVFGTVNDTDKVGPRILALNASFDGRDPSGGGQVKPYYVPNACVQCHNGEKAKVNYIDTDHLYDRVQPHEDFEQMRPLPPGVLLDGGKVTADGGSSDTTPRYEAAFAHVRTLNQEYPRAEPGGRQQRKLCRPGRRQLGQEPRELVTLSAPHRASDGWGQDLEDGERE